jgi:Tfp pilus assembly protein PilX
MQKALLDNRKGSALITALLLVAVSGIMGATILFATSTELQISGNYRRAIQTFYAAEAGLAETQRRFSGSPASNPVFLGDVTSPHQSNWSAYVSSKAGWKPADDHTYNVLLTNYVPLAGNAGNTLAQPNSVQTDLAYWTKVHHKTEYDAKQAGHRLATPHYIDGYGVTTLHSTSNRGHLVRFGYPLLTSVKPEQFTTTLPNMYPPVEMITSHGQVEGADSILQADVFHPAGPPVVGAHVRGE